ncbi:outer membrane beta-barrel protein [Bergeyella zoohelcum]|uniref:outer membrane beta-barrel protein n=1 Tax=Bergeyella zoohelcum TaxID=1015 RepID=UPI0037357E23
MKKFLFASAFALLGTVTMNAQKLGVTGGLAHLGATAKLGNEKATNSATGGYIGLLAELPLGAKVKFVPGVNYIFVENSGGVQVPLIFKFNVAEGLNLQAGPQFLFDSGEVPEQFKNYYNKTNIAIAIGAGYDINDNFFIDARYGIQVNNHLKNIPSIANASVRVNTLSVGVGYKF